MFKNKVRLQGHEAKYCPSTIKEVIAAMPSSSVSPVLIACKRYLAAKVINNKVGGKGDEQ